MIASLPMYDRPETAAANDRLWQAIRAHLSDAPTTLTRSPDPWTDWQAPDLLLSQTCSLPFRTSLHEQVQIVGASIHDLPCESGFYHSVLAVRADDPRDGLGAFAGAPIAINAAHSQSGWGALWAMAEATNITLGPATVTGSHRASAQSVAEGSADLAAIDAVTWQMIDRWDAFAQSLRVLCNTPATPALPFITRAGNDVPRLRRAVQAGIEALSNDDQTALCLYGIKDVAASDYMALPVPPRPCLSPQNA